METETDEWTSIRVTKTTAGILKSFGKKNYDDALRGLMALTETHAPSPPIPEDEDESFRWSFQAGPLVVFLSDLGEPGKRWLRFQSPETDLAFDLPPDQALALSKGIQWALAQQGDAHEKRNDN